MNVKTCGNLRSHPVHEPVLRLLVSGGRNWLSALLEFVINIEENVESVHDGALSGGGTGEREQMGIGNAFIQPAGPVRTIRIAALVPRTDAPVEGVRLATIADGLNRVIHVLNHCGESHEVLGDFEERRGIGTVGEGAEILDDLEELNARKFRSGGCHVETSLVFRAGEKVT